MKLTGFLFILMGVLALIFPFVAGVATELLIGAAFVIAGGGHFFQTLQNTRAENRPGHLAIGAIVLVGGIALLAAPMAGIVAFTLLIAISFILQGLTQGYFALIGSATANRGWLLISSAFALIAGGLILAGWPSSAHWLVGVMVGINFLFTGIAILTTKIETIESD